MKILIVEDDSSVRRMVCKMLIYEGYEVLEAENGLKAIKLLRDQSDIELVITDIVMPEKEGLETIQDIKEYNSMIKIIAMSGGGKIDAESYLNLAKHLGADATLGKPFYKKDLLDVVLATQNQTVSSAG